MHRNSPTVRAHERLKHSDLKVFQCSFDHRPNAREAREINYGE
jgi:hypothetical protein